MSVLEGRRYSLQQRKRLVEVNWNLNAVQVVHQALAQLLDQSVLLGGIAGLRQGFTLWKGKQRF